MLQTGTVLNQRYEIVRLIAQGGMGAVYEGRDLKFGGSPVAIKQCLLTGELMQRAFVREAELLANLSHPGVAKVRDLFAEADVRYLIMEYIPGRDLEEILNDRGQAIPIEEALEWMDQALEALNYMHSRRPSVIHRDIKPSNLKLTPSGHVILIDFGLAKGSGATSLIGYSANFAPLEQLQGEGTDARSDLYSLGATMYRLLTGLAPESSLSRVKQLAKGQRDPLLRVNAINSQASPAVGQVIWEAMALEREDRLQSADEMRRRLREARKSPASNIQQIYTPTEAHQGVENNSRDGKFDTNVMSNAQAHIGSSHNSTPRNEQFISLLAGPDNPETNKAGGKIAKIKLGLVSVGIVMLLFLIVEGVNYRNRRIALSQQQQAARQAETRQQENQLKAVDRGSVGQVQQSERQEPADPGVTRQKQTGDQAAQEEERRRQAAAVQEEERRRQAAAVQEEERRRQAAAVQEEERRRQETASREAERQRQELATREAERRRQETASREAERQRQEVAAREAERRRQETASREAERQRQEAATREAERQRRETAAREAEVAKQKEAEEAAQRKAEKQAKKRKKEEEKKKLIEAGVVAGASILGEIFRPKPNKQ